MDVKVLEKPQPPAPVVVPDLTPSTLAPEPGIINSFEQNQNVVPEPSQTLNEPLLGSAQPTPQSNLEKIPPAAPEGSHLEDTVIITPEVRAQPEQVKTELNANQTVQPVQSAEQLPTTTTAPGLMYGGNDTGAYIPPTEVSGNQWFANQQVQNSDQAPTSAPQKSLVQRLMFWKK